MAWSHVAEVHYSIYYIMWAFTIQVKKHHSTFQAIFVILITENHNKLSLLVMSCSNIKVVCIKDKWFLVTNTNHNSTELPAG